MLKANEDKGGLRKLKVVDDIDLTNLNTHVIGKE